MSIASEITRISENIADSYTAVSGKGGTLPVNQNSDNLPDAIASIPSGGSGPDVYIPRTLTTSGNDVVLGKKDITETVFSTKNATVIDSYALNYAFYDANSIPNINLPNVVEARSYAFQYAFAHSSKITSSRNFTFSAPNLTTVGDRCFDHAFRLDSPCESFSLPAVTQISGSGVFSNAFELNTKVEAISFAELKTMSNSLSCFYMFARGTTNLTSFNFDKLETITSCGSAFSNALAWGTGGTKTHDLTILFSALKTITDSSNAFSNFAQYNRNVVSMSFPSLETITNSQSCFSSAYSMDSTQPQKAYFPKLRTISNSSNAFSNFMSYSTGTYLEDFDFGLLDGIVNSGGCFSNAFIINLGTKCSGRVNLFPKLRRINASNNYTGAEFSSAFDRCSKMTSCVFPELEYIYHATKQDSYGAFYRTFINCSNCTKLEFPKFANANGGFLCELYANGLTEIVFGQDIQYFGPYSLSSVFTSKSNLDFTIPICSVGGDNAIRQLGLSTSVIRFPILGNIQSNNKYTMINMLSGGSDNTVHFRKDMQSVIETVFGATPTFGGTNTTVLYDIVSSVNDGTTTYLRFHNGYNTTSYGYEHDYFDGANGVRYYKTPTNTSSGTLVFPDGTSYDNQQWYTWVDGNNNEVITFNRNPVVGDYVWSHTSGTPILTTIASITYDRVFVPNTAEPQVGDTLYSDEACTQAVGTVSTIA